MANQDLVYDITKVPELQPKQQTIYGRVGDGGLKAVTVKVISNGSDYNLTGLLPVFEGLKPDGTHVIDKNGGTVLDPQGGIFRYVFPSQTFTAKGDYAQAFFKLMRGDQTDSTIDIAVRVYPNQVEFGINSTNLLSEYDEVMAAVKEKEQAFEDNINNQLKILVDKQNTLEGRIDANDFVGKVDFSHAALIDANSMRKI